MQTQTTAPEVGQSGVADDEFVGVLDTVDKPASPPAADNVREVKIRVPGHIPDNVVYNAWQIGMGTVQRLGMGLLVVAFPSVGKGPNGQPVNTIGKAEMIISKSEDVQRVLDLIDVINKVNQQIFEASKQPANLLTATIEGKRMKDEALRQAKQAASGEVPLVLAKEQPKPTPGKIQIASR